MKSFIKTPNLLPGRRHVIPARKGFTLIELLVVIAIIALLIALLFPVAGSMLDRSRMTTCMSRLRELGLALQSYEIENGKPPPTINWNNAYKWMQYLYEDGHVRDTRSYYCPSRPMSAFVNFSPVGKVAYNTECSYGYNDLIGNIAQGNNQAKNIYQIGNPSQIVVFADSLYYRLIDDQNWQWWYQADPRHNEKANVVYADGSVMSKTFDEIYKSPYF